MHAFQSLQKDISKSILYVSKLVMLLSSSKRPGHFILPWCSSVQKQLIAESPWDDRVQAAKGATVRITATCTKRRATHGIEKLERDGAERRNQCESADDGHRAGVHNPDEDNGKVALWPSYPDNWPPWALVLWTPVHWHQRHGSLAGLGQESCRSEGKEQIH